MSFVIISWYQPNPGNGRALENHLSSFRSKRLLKAELTSREATTGHELFSDAHIRMSEEVVLMESSTQSRDKKFNETTVFQIDNENVRDELLDTLFKLDFNQKNFESTKNYQWDLYILPLEQEVFESATFTFEDNSKIEIESYSWSGVITGNLTLNNETFVFSYDSYTYKEVKPRFIFFIFTLQNTDGINENQFGKDLGKNRLIKDSFSEPCIWFTPL
jgi:hypothetical protein